MTKSDVFTVILLSDRSSHRFKRWQVLFEPFEREGLLKICEWDRRGPQHGLPQVVPGLADAIHGKSKWRAIVVDTLADPEHEVEETAPDNPFDYRDNIEAGRELEQLGLAPSPHPLIHLSHLLLGYPEIGPKAFVANPSYWDVEKRERVYLSETMDLSPLDDEASEANINAILGGKRDVQVHYREMPYSDEEINTHRELVKKYRLPHARPKEVVFLATRELKTPNPMIGLRRAWGTPLEYVPSRFVERNDYPASCRFLVHDLPRVDDNRYEIEQLRFWLGLLSIAVNELPASALQAERLYRIELELDDKKLGEVLNAQLTQLAAERDFAEVARRQRQRRTDKTVEEILMQEPLRVSFDDIGGEDLLVSTSGYSWASDFPRRESMRWQDSMNSLRSLAESFSRRPRRVLSRTVEQVRDKSLAFRNEDIVLDKISLDELEEELANQSQELAQPAMQKVLDRAELKDRIDQHDLRVRRAIAQRMEKRTILAASGVVALVWLLAFTPYLIVAAWRLVDFAESFGVVALVIGVLASLGITTLIFMRYRLLRLIKEVNSDLRRYVASVNAGASEFAAYLTAVLTYMRGQSILVSTKRGGERARQIKLDLDDMYQRLEDEIESLKSIIRAAGQELMIEKTATSRLRELGASDELLRQLFYWPQGSWEARLNSTGEKIRAPYDFIESLSIVNLNITDPKLGDLTAHAPGKADGASPS